jgi:hypothetical protein
MHVSQMKRLILFLVFLSWVFLSIAQPVQIPMPMRFKGIYQPAGTISKHRNEYVSKPSNRIVEFNWPQELTIGSTYYDMQSERSAPAGRLALFSDRTMSAVWSFALDTVSFLDQGTAYSYYDGSEWSAFQALRIESMPTKSPCIALSGSGEVIVSSPLIPGPIHKCYRPDKGTGAWVESDLPLPAGTPGMTNPKMVSSGLGHSVIHVISLTSPVSQGGVLLHGQDGALLYQRSSDYGNSWEINGLIPAGLDSSQYNGFDPDTYAFAEPQGNKLAFVIGDPWSDLLLMRSDDGGNSWQKTVIWQHPIPHWNGEATDSIYCPDGSVHLAFDNTGTIRVVFGITRLFSDGSQVYRFPYVGGIGQWREGMSTWTGGDQYDCLNPDSLEAEGRLACSYLMDWNNNGTLDLIGNFGDYNVGPISFPQIAYDQYGVGMLVMSSVTEAYNNNVQDYRHIWYKYLYNDLIGSIVFDWDQQPEHLFHEGVYPCLASHSPDNIGWPLWYQLDSSAGIAMAGDLDPFEENFINRVDLNYMLQPPSVTVSVSASPVEAGIVSGGTFTPNGSMVTIEAHANPGWEFVNWTSQGAVFSTDSVYTFQAVWNYNLVAHFKLMTGLDNHVNNPVSVYPNPATSGFTITFSNQSRGQNLSIELLDMSGTRVKMFSCSGEGKEFIDVNDLAGGVYILIIRKAEGERIVKRVILE